jgi:hypothetical protein
MKLNPQTITLKKNEMLKKTYNKIKMTQHKTVSQ